MDKGNNESENGNISEKIKENLDLIVASGGIFLGIFIIYIAIVTGIRQGIIGFTIFISSLIYILLRKKLIKCSDTIDFKPSTSLFLVNNITFSIIIALSVWLLWSNLYIRPLSYFILVSIAFASVALEILYANKKQGVWLILFKILLIEITLGGGIYFMYDGIQGMYEGIQGMDALAHNSQIEIYIETGHIVEDPNPYRPTNEYYWFPIHYVLSASTSILTSLGVYASIFISIAFLEAFSIVFVFFIGQKIVNTKIGLFAALLFSTSNFQVRWVTSPAPMVLGVVFFTIILYLFVAKTSIRLQNRILILFLFIILILTHTIAAFVLLVVLFVLFIGKNINKYLQKANVKVSLYVFAGTVIVFGVLLFGYWMYAFQAPGYSFFDSSLYSLKKGLLHDVEFGGSTEEVRQTYKETKKYINYILDNMGYLLVLFFGIIGTYMWIRIRNDYYKLLLSLVMITLFAIMYGFLLFGLREILPTRWIIFIYLILMMVSTYGMFKLISLINKGLIKKASLVLLIFSISFFMIGSTPSNHNYPLFDKESVWKGEGYKTSELAGKETINNIFNGTIKSTIFMYAGVFPLSINEKYNTTYAQLNNEAWSTPDINFLFSEYNLTNESGNMYVIDRDAFTYPHVFKYIGPALRIPFILNETVNDKLNSKGNEIYDNGEVWGYVIMKE